jgi:glycosyltransferase involved in cell wall biosynthesis
MLGGSMGRVDVLTRSHVFLLEALDALRERRPDLAGRFELHLVGDLTEQDRTMIRQSYVHCRGYRPHREAVSLMKSADLLFLPMHDLEPGRRATIVPGKTYEYMAAGPPILGAVPEGDARDFLVKSGRADVCGPSDVAAMSAAVERRIDGHLAGRRWPTADEEFVRTFERRHLTELLVAVLDRVIGDRSAIEAELDIAPARPALGHWS